MASGYETRARPPLRLRFFSPVRSEREAEILQILIASFFAWPGLAHLTGLARHPVWHGAWAVALLGVAGGLWLYLSYPSVAAAAVVALVRLAVTFERTLEAAPAGLADSDRLAWEIPRTSAVVGSVGLLLLALRAALLVRELRSLPPR